MAKKELCPCCGLYVHVVRPGGHRICPICKWQDDNVQKLDPDFTGGANKVSLNQARALFEQGKDKRGNPIMLPLLPQSEPEKKQESIKVMATCRLVMTEGRTGVLV